MRLLVIITVIATHSGTVACRSSSHSSSVGRVDRAWPDAAVKVTCSAQLAALRQHLAFAPLEQAWLDMNKDVPPSATVQLVPIGAMYRPLIRVTLADVHWTGWMPIDKFDAEYFEGSLEIFYRKTSEPLLFVQVDARAPLQGLRAVRDGLAAVEGRMRRTFAVGLLFRYPPEIFKPYEVPLTMPAWAREEVSEFRRTERYQGNVPGFARRALSRAAPACPTGVAAGVAVTEMVAHDVTLEGALIDALAACDCRELDLDAFAGLVLGAIGYRNPYGYVRLATSPRAKHRIKVPLTGSMADIAAAWPANAGDEAVWIDFE